LFYNDNNLLGLGPSTLAEDDFVVIALGAAVPWIIRTVEENLYEYVGQCYIHGLMDGEWYDHVEKNGEWYEKPESVVKFRDITLK
jgi:hypothetical protein